MTPLGCRRSSFFHLCASFALSSLRQRHVRMCSARHRPIIDRLSAERTGADDNKCGCCHRWIRGGPSVITLDFHVCLADPVRVKRSHGPNPIWRPLCVFAVPKRGVVITTTFTLMFTLRYVADHRYWDNVTKISNQCTLLLGVRKLL